MTRFSCARTALRLLVTALLCACTDPGSGTGTTETTAANVYAAEGVVFKGPLAEGTTVTVQPLNEALQPVGEPITSVVGPFGRYAASGSGLVAIDTTGTVFDEATAEFSTRTLTLSGYGEFSEDASAVQLNLLTDLTRPRVADLVAQGRSFANATAEAEGELANELGLGRTPGRGARIDVYGTGADEGWVFAASSIISQAGLLRETNGTGTLPSLLDDLRQALRNGPFPDALRAELQEGQRTLDPALPRLGLSEQERIQVTGDTLPNLEPFLDTDFDGIKNNVDVCPFIADPDQIDSAGRGWGDACDIQVAAISIADRFGCVLLEADGSLACWSYDLPPLGGVPPHPFEFPANTRAPWGAGPGLDAKGYTDVELGPRIACASTTTGVSCFSEGEVWEVDLGDDRVDLAVNGSRVCSLSDDGLVTCLDHDGSGALEMPVSAQQVAPYGARGICVRDNDAALACLDATTAEPLPDLSLPTGAFRHLDGTQTDASIYGCAISSTNGSIQCWGDVLPDMPPAADYTDLATGIGLACAERDGAPAVCWRDAAICPPIPEGELRLPPGSRRLTVDDCVVGAVGGDGLGYAWPRYWFRRPGAVP